MSLEERLLILVMAIQDRIGALPGCALVLIVLVLTYPIWFAYELVRRHPGDPARAWYALLEWGVLLFCFANLARYAVGLGWAWPFSAMAGY